jgi:hypothetical protein
MMPNAAHPHGLRILLTLLEPKSSFLDLVAWYCTWYLVPVATQSSQESVPREVLSGFVVERKQLCNNSPVGCEKHSLCTFNQGLYSEMQ